MRFAIVVLTGVILGLGAFPIQAKAQEMSFFVTSVGVGDGGNLGGLEGADAHCQQLAEAAGSAGRTWRAYLSTQAEGKRGESARLRIGQGPWHNALGELIASDLDQLHILVISVLQLLSHIVKCFNRFFDVLLGVDRSRDQSEQ